MYLQSGEVNFSEIKVFADDRETERLGEYREDPATATRTQVGESRSSLDPRGMKWSDCAYSWTIGVRIVFRN